MEIILFSSSEKEWGTCASLYGLFVVERKGLSAAVLSLALGRRMEGVAL